MNKQESKEEIKTVTFKKEKIKLPFSCYIDKQPYKFALDKEITAKYCVQVCFDIIKQLSDGYEIIKQNHIERELNKLWYNYICAKWGGEYRFDNIHKSGKDSYYVECFFGSLHCCLAIKRTYFKNENVKLRLTKKDIEKMVETIHERMKTDEWKNIKER